MPWSAVCTDVPLALCVGSASEHGLTQVLAMLQEQGQWVADAARSYSPSAWAVMLRNKQFDDHLGKLPRKPSTVITVPASDDSEDPRATGSDELPAQHSGSDAERVRKCLYPPDPSQKARWDLPIRIYLSRGTESEGAEVARSVASVISAFGFEIAREDASEHGSWFKRLIGVSKDAITREELQERLRKLERGLELRYLEQPQASADQPRMEGAAELLDKIGDNDAVIQIGSILLVKRHSPNGSGQIVIRTLTQNELIYLDKHGECLRDPIGILNALERLGRDDKHPMSGRVTDA